MTNEGLKLLNLMAVMMENWYFYLVIERSIEWYQSHYGCSWKEWDVLRDYTGKEFEVGDVVFFEFTYYRKGGSTLPRKGRITKIDLLNERIQVISNNWGGYCEHGGGMLCHSHDCPEPTAGKYQERSGYFSLKRLNFWRKMWVVQSQCPIVIGGPSDKLCEC